MDEYYLSQAGSGISGFTGVRYQRGSGFFGRLLTGSILPLIKKVLPYLGRQAVDTGLNIADDVMGGRNIKESVKDRFKDTAKLMAGDTIAQVKQMRGRGYKRKGVRRRRKKRYVPRPKKQNKRKRRKRKIRRASDFL